MVLHDFASLKELELLIGFLAPINIPVSQTQSALYKYLLGAFYNLPLLSSWSFIISIISVVALWLIIAQMVAVTIITDSFWAK